MAPQVNRKSAASPVRKRAGVTPIYAVNGAELKAAAVEPRIKTQVRETARSHPGHRAPEAEAEAGTEP